MENKAYMQEPPPVGYTQQPVGTGELSYGQPSQTVIVTQPTMSTAVVTRPPNYFALSLFSCLFCFWPTGLLAIYFSSKTNSLMSCGDMTGAERASKTARTLSIASIVVGCLGMVIIIILAATGNLVAGHYKYVY